MTEMLSDKILLVLAGVGAAGALTFTACAHIHSAPTPTPGNSSAPVVLPWQQSPDDACHPKTLADMFIPCDTKDDK